MNKIIIPFEWEDITHYEKRAKVYGGWVLKSFTDVAHYSQDEGMIDGRDFRPSLIFIHDPNYNWQIKETINETSAYDNDFSPL